MSHRAMALLIVLGTLATLLWRHELFTVQRPGETPRALVATDVARREPARFDAALPVVPMGMRRLRDDDGATLVYYWAPWQQGSYAQAAALDSLRREPGLADLRVVIVCFDPYPSVARFVARRRLGLPVLLDLRGELRAQLPCPSIPYTYVIDPSRRIAVAQPGRVDWWSAGTRRTLETIAREPVTRMREAGEAI
jgi:hypothetical protein